MMTRNHSFAATLEKVEQIDEIMKYGVMMTPALVVNEQVKSTGRIPAVPRDRLVDNGGHSVVSAINWFQLL